MASIETNMREGLINDYLIDAGKKIEKGNFIFAREATGYAFQPTASDTAAAGDRFLGIAVETIDNTGGAAGALSCRVSTYGVHQIPQTGFDQAQVGDRVKLAANGGSITTASVTTYYVGVVVAVSSTLVDVQIDNAIGNIYA